MSVCSTAPASKPSGGLMGLRCFCREATAQELSSLPSTFYIVRCRRSQSFFTSLVCVVFYALQLLEGVGTPSCSSDGTIATPHPVAGDQ